MPEEIYDTVRAAEELKVSPRTLERWRYEDRGPPFIRYGTGRGARVVYHRADLQAWKAANRVVPGSAEADELSD